MPMTYWQKVAFALIAILGGCTTSLHTEVVEPPKAKVAAQLRKVAVLPFTGPAGEQLTDEVESVLAQATDRGQPFYTVVDRRTLQHAMNELQLHQSGLVDQGTALRLGKFVGADGVYTGAVFIPSIARSNHNEQRYGCAATAHPGRVFSACTSPTTTTVPCLNKIAQITIVPRLIAVGTAQVVYQPTITGRAQSSSCIDQAGEVDDGTLLGQAVTQALEKLREDVTPHVRKLDVVLKTDTAGLNASSSTRFENGMAFAHAARLDRACASWRNLLMENPTSVTLGFDVAVCDESEDQLSAALHRVNDLDSSLQRPDADINELRMRLQAEIQSNQTLQRPISVSANGPSIRSGSGRPVSGDSE